MKTISQNEEIYQLLIDRGESGINSFEPLRNNKRQLPRIIDDIESPVKRWKLGGKIEHKREKNTSVTYIYRPNGIQFTEKSQPKFVVENGVYKAIL